MFVALSILSFIASNVFVFTYGHLSAGITSWKTIFLFPLLWFPILYALNILFSTAFLMGGRAQLGITSLLLINVGAYFLVLFLGNIFVWKEQFSGLQIAGAIMIALGAVAIIVFRP